MSNANISLKGQYRVKVFDQFDNLKTDTDFLDNLITNTGLRFPYDIAFSDCFRYLSLGSGQASAATGNTGIQSGISGFQYLGIYNAVTGFKSFDVLNGAYPPEWYYMPEGCGTNLNTGSVELFRTWRVPTGLGFAEMDYVGNQKIYELVTSPSAPVEQLIQDKQDTDPYFGTYLPFDASNAKFNLAFSRMNISNGLSLLSGDYALVTYKLTVYPNVKPTGFSKTFTTARFKNSMNGITACTGWTGTISGIYGLVHPGIKLISDEAGSLLNGYVPEEFLSPNVLLNSSQSKFGLSYTPQIGIPLEPSNENTYYAYLSDDNVQFLANKEGGEIPVDATGLYYPYNSAGIRPSGICSYKPEFPKSGTDSLLYNIRRSDAGRIYPSADDLRVGVLSSSSHANSQAGTVSAKVNLDNHYRSITYTWGASLGQNIVSSLVLATKDSSQEVYYPFLDMVFNTTDGRLLPQIVPIAGLPPTSGFIAIPNDIETKLFLDGLNVLDLVFNLSWGR